MTIIELTNNCFRILNALDGATTETYTSLLTNTDPKWSVEHVQSFIKHAIAEVANLEMLAGRKDSLHMFCKRRTHNAAATVALGDNTGRYTIDEDLIDGPIVIVEITFDTTGATIDSVPDSYTGYEYAEPDSASAIRRYRTRYTAGKLEVPMYSYAIEGKQIYYTGSRIAITYVPDDVGSNASTSLPNKYANAVVAMALSYLFAYAGGASYVNAAAYFSRLASEARQLILAGKPELVSAAQAPYGGM
jgi:hypothetical protein